MIKNTAILATVGVLSAHVLMAAAPPTNCQIAQGRMADYKATLERTFPNHATSPVEAQQYNMAKTLITGLEGDVGGANQTTCLQKMMVLNQVLRMSGASQVASGSYTLPANITPIKTPYDCDKAEKRLADYKQLSTNFPENKFVADVINPRIPKLDTQIQAMREEVNKKLAEQEKEKQEFNTKQTNDKSLFTSNQLAEKERLLSDQKREDDKASEDFKNANDDTKKMEASERLRKLPAKHKADMDNLIARQTTDAKNLAEKQRKELEDLKAKLEAEINAIKARHNALCVESMTPIENIVNTIANAPKVN